MEVASIGAAGVRALARTAAVAVTTLMAVLALATAVASAAETHSELTPPMGIDPYYSNLDTGGAVDAAGIRATATFLASSGMRRLGYREVALGNWWKNGERNPDGTIALDASQYPDGVKPVTDWLHARGFTVRAYSDVGPLGCIKPTANSYGHYQQDADTVAAWGIDAMMIDWCGAYIFGWRPDQIRSAYTELAHDLAHNASHRPVTLDMALYDPRFGSDNASWASQIAETFRVGQDIGALGRIEFSRVLAAIDRTAAHPNSTRPGHYRDADMVVAGVGPISDSEGRLQMSMWAMLSTPLILGTDLQHMSATTRETVTNPEIIAIDQDPLVKMASQLGDDGPGREIWVKRLAAGERAVALLNRTDHSASIATSARAAGLPRADAYRLRDVWKHATTTTGGRIAATVPGHGVAVYRVAVAPARARTSVPDVSLSLATAGAAGAATGELVGQVGRATTVSVDVENHGVVPVSLVHVALAAPAGWRSVAQGAPNGAIAPRGHATLRWRVTPAAGAKVGTYALRARVRYRAEPAGGSVVAKAGLRLAAAPSGSPYLSDLPFLATVASGWTPVVRDFARPVTIEGAAYAKGITLPAPASADVYLGGRCSRFTSALTLNDHDAFGQPHHAKVTVRVLRDGKQAYTQVLESGATQTVHVDLDVSGAQSLRLQADDTGDYWNYAYGFAQWGGAQLTCAG